MRIAQIAPLEEAVPPKLYGGIERMVSYLTEALVEAGHEVTLFASSDSQTSAKLEGCWHQALRLDPTIRDKNVPRTLMLERVLHEADKFDILHFHTDFSALPALTRQPLPFVLTTHGPLDLPELQPFFKIFDDVPLISCYERQHGPLPQANWLSTIHHGIPEKQLVPVPNPTLDYVAFLGRISPEKRIEAAVQIAQLANLKLKVAAKIDPFDQVYYEKHVKDLFALPHVEFVGEISEADKAQFLGNAAALLFPVAWPESFGLVMIEAFACGTPVVALRYGSVPEVVDHAVTGFIVDDVRSTISVLRCVNMLSRRKIREVFEKRFTSKIMAEKYVKAYEKLLLQTAEEELSGN